MRRSSIFSGEGYKEYFIFWGGGGWSQVYFCQHYHVNLYVLNFDFQRRGSRPPNPPSPLHTHTMCASSLFSLLSKSKTNIIKLNDLKGFNINLNTIYSRIQNKLTANKIEYFSIHLKKKTEIKLIEKPF